MGQLLSISHLLKHCTHTLVAAIVAYNTGRQKLNLKVEDKRAKTHTYTGEFFVLDMKSQDIILGLPALTGKLYPFMDELLRQATGS